MRGAAGTTRILTIRLGSIVIFSLCFRELGAAAGRVSEPIVPMVCPLSEHS
jgi:hypothetical protein